MKKWRKKLSLAAISVGLLTLAPSFANAECGSCEPCDPCNWDFCSFGGFDIEVDYLWWKPCVDDLDYAAVFKNADNTKFEYRSICPDWEPGVRITFGVPNLFCNFGFTGSWTYIKSHETSSVTNTDDVMGTLLHGYVNSNVYIEAIKFDKAKGEWEAEYNEWEALLYYDLSCNNCHHLKPFFGVAGITLYQELEADYYDGTTKDGKAEWESDFWGAGFRIGADYLFRFSDCLSFFVKGSGTLLAGTADSEHVSRGGFNERNSTYSYNVLSEDDDCCHIIPGCAIGVGVVYDTCFCNFDISFKLGYEFINWYNLPNQRVFPTGYSQLSAQAGDSNNLSLIDGGIWNQSHSTSPSTRTFGFHGITAGLAFSF